MATAGEAPGDGATSERGAAEEAGGSRVPDFFIVGHPKCGTTALHEILSRDSRIFMSDVKEPQFFATDLWADSEAPANRRSPRTFEQYASLYANARPDQLVGDASTRHIWSRTAAALIAKAQPGARIVAVLREPASFLRSLHMQLLQNRSEDEPDLRTALALEDERRQGRSLSPLAAKLPQVLMYAERVRYVEQLQRYHDVFASEQILTLIYDDFRHDNTATVRQVLRFLGLSDSSEVAAVEANPTVRRRTGVDEGLFALAYGRGPAAAAAKRAIMLVTPRRLRRQAFGVLQRNVVLGRPEAADEDLTLELKRRFKPEVQALSELLGRDLIALWGYDDID